MDPDEIDVEVSFSESTKSEEVSKVARVEPRTDATVRNLSGESTRSRSDKEDADVIEFYHACSGVYITNKTTVLQISTVIQTTDDDEVSVEFPADMKPQKFSGVSRQEFQEEKKVARMYQPSPTVSTGAAQIGSQKEYMDTSVDSQISDDDEVSVEFPVHMKFQEICGVPPHEAQKEKKIAPMYQPAESVSSEAAQIGGQKRHTDISADSQSYDDDEVSVEFPENTVPRKEQSSSTQQLALQHWEAEPWSATSSADEVNVEIIDSEELQDVVRVTGSEAQSGKENIPVFRPSQHPVIGIRKEVMPVSFNSQTSDDDEVCVEFPMEMDPQQTPSMTGQGVRIERENALIYLPFQYVPLENRKEDMGVFFGSQISDDDEVSVELPTTTHIAKAHNLKGQLPEGMDALATTIYFVTLNCGTLSSELQQTALSKLLRYLCVRFAALHETRMRDGFVISIENYTICCDDADEKKLVRALSAFSNVSLSLSQEEPPRPSSNQTLKEMDSDETDVEVSFSEKSEQSKKENPVQNTEKQISNVASQKKEKEPQETPKEPKEEGRKEKQEIAPAKRPAQDVPVKTPENQSEKEDPDTVPSEEPISDENEVSVEIPVQKELKPQPKSVPVVPRQKSLQQDPVEAPKSYQPPRTQQVVPAESQKQPKTTTASIDPDEIAVEIASSETISSPRDSAGSPSPQLKLQRAGKTSIQKLKEFFTQVVQQKPYSNVAPEHEGKIKHDKEERQQQKEGKKENDEDDDDDDSDEDSDTE
ncbi:hypothetical protein RB195_020027 [Necator americanus]|uniref:Uncharacterized protein n=1 Tax=Necator americanus TaxID=51031 RepID=A0ABR1CIS4_NECAM